MFLIKFGINEINDRKGSFLVEDMNEHRLELVSRLYFLQNSKY